ncbi:MAG: hypothetical protein HY520_00250 [Candidatus Aenigmarchaeota archaeon]|nr:hypothetical protein [Candidatus Aenigmarchaeota archaeon]
MGLFCWAIHESKPRSTAMEAMGGRAIPALQPAPPVQAPAPSAGSKDIPEFTILEDKREYSVTNVELVGFDLLDAGAVETLLKRVEFVCGTYGITNLRALAVGQPVDPKVLKALEAALGVSTFARDGGVLGVDFTAVRKDGGEQHCSVRFSRSIQAFVYYFLMERDGRMRFFIGRAVPPEIPSRAPRAAQTSTTIWWEEGVACGYPANFVPVARVQVPGTVQALSDDRVQLMDSPDIQEIRKLTQELERVGGDPH